MSLFETIKNVIFHNPLGSKASSGTPPAQASSSSSPASSSPPASTARPGAPAAATTATSPQPPRAAPSTASTAPASATPSQPVDVEAVLNALNAKQTQKLNWQSSIVDLMKLVGLDSSMQHRKELATELGYTGDQNDSAAMNVWLHKAVMRKLAENGGRVPSSLQ
jgi:3-oxoacyl-ACP reductase-like protein